MVPHSVLPPGRAAVEAGLLDEAREFLQLLERETGRDTSGRLADVEAEVRRRGTYWQTLPELEHGSRVAWRNNTRCIGRFHWSTLQVRDMRHLEDVEAVFEAVVDHVRLSSNLGRIRPLITVFAPQQPGREGWRIWNSQLIRYAGYPQPDGSIVGDPLNARLTEALRALGWSGGRGGPFDVLPLVIQKPGEAARVFELPRDVVLEVPLSHPTYPWFPELGLRWHALPAISNMRLEIGGISYTAAPFSGWYMVTEIGARNLGDLKRYNLLPLIGERMGLDTKSERSLWRDRAIVELNIAVIHSFIAHGVAIVDHHTACKQFVWHEKRETQAGRIVPAEWSWMVPPISGSTTPVFHHSYFPDVTLKPNFLSQPNPWRSRRAGAP
jgi:nitric-oxide synthase, bacterial